MVDEPNGKTDCICVRVCSLLFKVIGARFLFLISQYLTLTNFYYFTAGFGQDGSCKV